MILKAVFNNQTEFRLTKWDYPEFKSTVTLYLQSMDIMSVKTACTNIQSLDIYQGDALIASFTVFDSFEKITYLGQQYVDGEGIFAETLAVTLTKSDIYSQIQKLDEKINPVIDVDTMDVEEYRSYKLKQLSEECSSSIYAGDQVTLSDGTVETFSFKDKDQTDLQALSNLAMMNPKIELTWHSNGNLCKFYSGIDIIIIYQTLNMKLFREVTICNAISLLIKTAQSKDEIDQYYWGCTLPEEEQERVNGLITKMETIVAEIMSHFIDNDEEEE